MDKILYAIRLWLGLELQPFRLSPEDMRSTLHFEKRRHKALEVESCASEARPMLAVITTPGTYIGLGDRVIPATSSKTHDSETVLQYH